MGTNRDKRGMIIIKRFVLIQTHAKGVHVKREMGVMPHNVRNKPLLVQFLQRFLI